MVHFCRSYREESGLLRKTRVTCYNYIRRRSVHNGKEDEWIDVTSQQKPAGTEERERERERDGSTDRK